MAQISERLQRIANQVPAGVKAADIGTDHGLLPIYLVENKDTPHAVASDIRRGPLNAARRNIQSAGLEHIIEARLGSGLKTLMPGEVDVAVIAGMGGKTITEILQESEDVVSKLQALVLQPMGASRLVRKYLHDNHFHIEYEDVFYDADRIYELITAVPVPQYSVKTEEHSAGTANVHTTDEYASYNDVLSLELAYEFGPYLLQHPSSALIDAVHMSLQRWKAAVTGLEHARGEAARKQKEWTEQRIAWMEHWLGHWM